MSYNVEELLILIASVMIVVGILSFFIGKRKTNSPIKAALMGSFFSIIPVLGIAFLFYLYSKEDLV